MKQTIIVLAVLLCLAACQYEIPELPKETQNGLDTFGCLVNGELVVPYENGYYQKKYIPHAEYNLQTKELKIIGYGQNYQMFTFTVINPQEAKVMIIDTVMYYPFNSNSDVYYGGNDIGEMELTYFNTANGIASGHFRFTGYKCSAIDKSIIDRNDFVTVTKGYFDINLTILNH